MAFSVTGKGKKIVISMAVVAVLMMIGGALAGGLLGGRWPEHVLTAISAGYAVWLATVLSQKAPEPGSPSQGPG
jgi:hypothetical protein